MRATLCLLIVLAGCSGKSGKPEDPASTLPQSLEATYRGRNAEAWGKALLDADERTSEEAATALAQIGKEGLRFLVRGMQSDRWMTRFFSVRALPSSPVREYPEVFVPLLTSLLQDKQSSVRQFAAAAIGSCGFKQALPDLHRAYDKETDEGTSRTMISYIGKLEGR